MSKKGFLPIFFAIFLLCTVSSAHGGTVTWKILEDSSAAGLGPGTDGLIGVPGCPGAADDNDTTSGEVNSCNLSSASNCATGATPSIGSFSYGVIEYAQDKSCLLGDNTGGACIDDNDCPGGSCMECPDVPDGWDTVFYLGDIGNKKANGTMTICQESGSSSYEFTELKLGVSESAAGLGPSCINLTPGGGPNTGDACGVDVLSNYSYDTTSKIGGCRFPAGRVDDSAGTARVIDVNDDTPTPTCGYSADDIACLQTKAQENEAKYLLISCSDDFYPDPSELTCMAGAHAIGVTVFWTADEASDCTSSCPAAGPCSATGTGE